VKPAAKNEKKIFVFIKRKGEIKCPKSGFLLLITGWGESGKAILNETIA